jgi:hypothetical protein
MNLLNTAKIALLTGFAAATLMTQPILAQAEEIVTDRGDGAAAINHGVTVLAWARVDGVSPATDDVMIDAKIITAENYDTASDSEWKYVNVRRTASATVDNEDRLSLEGVIEETEAKPHDAYFVRNDRSTVSQ